MAQEVALRVLNRCWCRGCFGQNIYKRGHKIYDMFKGQDGSLEACMNWPVLYTCICLPYQPPILTLCNLSWWCILLMYLLVQILYFHSSWQSPTCTDAQSFLYQLVHMFNNMHGTLAPHSVSWGWSEARDHPQSQKWKTLYIGLSSYPLKEPTLKRFWLCLTWQQDI